MSDVNRNRKILVAVTGASGSIYALRLLEELWKAGCDIHLVFSETGADVFKFETDIDAADISGWIEKISAQDTPAITVHDNKNLFAGPASGSFGIESMVIVPCSMSSLGSVANGTLQSLIGRAADVCLKEKRQLITVPRETPYNRIHLKNMLALDEAGATILPASPGFYTQPRTLIDAVNFVTARILDHLGIYNSLSKRWGE